MKSYSICLSPIDWLHFAWYPLCCCKWQDFILFLRPTNIPLCVYVPHLLYPFLYKWALRLLPYLVNNAAVNVGVHISFQSSFLVFFRKIPGTGITGLYGSSIFNFWGASILFSIVAAPIYLPTNSAQGFPFLHILTNTLFVVFLINTFDIIIVLLLIFSLFHTSNKLVLYRGRASLLPSLQWLHVYAQTKHRSRNGLRSKHWMTLVPLIPCETLGSLPHHLESPLLRQ